MCDFTRTPSGNAMIGVTLYDGPSRIDGKPIVCIASLYSRNEKTGPMIQTWILRKHVDPIAAIGNGGDLSICGDCPLRGWIERTRNGLRNRGRGCYVGVKNAPSQVWQAYRRGRYPTYDRAEHACHFHGRALRLGAYGDPVAVPLTTWRRVLPLATGWTGYTHQWRDPRFARWSQYVMASTHTTDENDQARAMGWRTFRTRLPDSPLADDEIACPASDEEGKRRTCLTCLACDGGDCRKRSVAIIGHGSPSVLSGVYRISN